MIDIHDIPGTYVFDGAHSRRGYHLNMFCMSLNVEDNRESFRANEKAYLEGFPMTPEQQQAVLDRDWLGHRSDARQIVLEGPHCGQVQRGAKKRARQEQKNHCTGLSKGSFLQPAVRDSCEAYGGYEAGAAQVDVGQKCREQNDEKSRPDLSPAD